MPNHNILLCMCLATLLVGCSPMIKPWERGILAKPHMAIQADGISNALRRHMQESKEASSGGRNGSGGGCGCS